VTYGKIITKEVIVLPFGLILPPALAIWLILGSWGDKLKAWRLNRLSAVILLLAAIVLSYIDIPLGAYYFNLGGLFILGFGLWIFFLLPGRHKWRAIGAAIIIAVLLFVIQSGLLWQIDQYTAYSGLAVLIVSTILAAATAEYRSALVAAAIGVEAAGLAWTLTGNGEMGLPFFNLFAMITAGAWLIIRVIDYFRQRQLTNHEE